jgi:hypothetical protein
MKSATSIALFGSVLVIARINEESLERTNPKNQKKKMLSPMTVNIGKTRFTIRGSITGGVASIAMCVLAGAV